jgi:ubiquitin thioesterase protein OTUB1
VPAGPAPRSSQSACASFTNPAPALQDPLTVGELVVRLNSENVSNLMIMLIRLVTSAEIQRRSDFFTPFILGMAETYMETEDFCRRYVECMGEESDHIQLVAVADAFQARASLHV